MEERQGNKYTGSAVYLLIAQYPVIWNENSKGAGTPVALYFSDHTGVGNLPSPRLSSVTDRWYLFYLWFVTQCLHRNHFATLDQRLVLFNIPPVEVMGWMPHKYSPADGDIHPLHLIPENMTSCTTEQLHKREFWQAQFFLLLYCKLHMPNFHLLYH